MKEIYKPKRTDIFRVTIKEEHPKGSLLTAIMYIIGFRSGIPHIINVSEEDNFKDDLYHDIVKDQLIEFSNNSYEFICHTRERDPSKAIEIARLERPEYFI